MMDEVLVGKRLEGRYEIQALIGEGGMANVYKGLDVLENRAVAIKILKPEFRDNEELVRRFKNESRAISVLNHPNIVKVYDINVADRLQYIIMEYIDGITLKEYIEQRSEPLTYKETVHFISQVLLALQHAHDKGIVHRDIKPQNIMLLEDGKVKVMDFGIARLARSESHTATDQAIGSVHYISPEQAKGDLTDPRADIYSLGITMYEMLTATLPFESDNAVSIAIKQISDEAKPILEVNPSVPEGLAAIVNKAMAKDPRKRYQSALDMLRDIEEFKRNPSIKFEYDYLAPVAPTRYMGKIMSQNSNGRKTSTKGKGSASSKGKKRRSLLIPIVGGVTLVVLIISVIMVINIFQNSGNPLFGKVETIELPNFVGMQESEAKTILQQEQYRLLRVDYITEFDQDKAAGEVLIQNTSPKTVKATQKVTLTVNKGTELVTIPEEILGMNRKEATQTILNLGLKPYVVVKENESATKGLVFDTNPAVGSQVENRSDQTVTIYIAGSKMENQVVVPDLVGLESMDAARELLAGQGLSLSTIYKEEYSDAPAGSIIAQLPEAGTPTFRYGTVRVTISKGSEAPPEPTLEYTTVPNLYGMEFGSASSTAAASGLSVAKTGDVYSSLPAGQIVSQSPGAGDSVPKGTVIGVQVSKGADPGTPSSTAPPASSTEPPAGSEGGG
ncbi:MAG: Stk1 family PASTA domain-containing Ser/Thr kinase [Oscillospiraceae bacterium]